MSIGFGIIVVAEVFLTLFIAWGIMNEEKFIRFEKKAAAVIRARLRYTRRRAAAARHRRINARVVYRPIPGGKPDGATRAA